MKTKKGLKYFTLFVLNIEYMKMRLFEYIMEIIKLKTLELLV